MRSSLFLLLRPDYPEFMSISNLSKCKEQIHSPLSHRCDAQVASQGPLLGRLLLSFQRPFRGQQLRKRRHTTLFDDLFPSASPEAPSGKSAACEKITKIRHEQRQVAILSQDSCYKVPTPEPGPKGPVQQK